MNDPSEVSPSPDSSRRRGYGRSRGHDAACDQCRSKKIRCNRQQPVCLQCARRKSTCSWANQGRKTNQVTDGLQGIDHRLHTIESSLQSIMQHLQPSGLPGPPAQYNNRIWSTKPDASDLVHNIPKAARFSSTQGPSPGSHTTFSAAAQARTQFYGSSSLHALINDTNKVIASRISQELSQNDIDTSETIWSRLLAQQARAQNELLEVLDSDTIPYIDAEGSLTLPPQRVLEAVIEPYFMHIESEIPLLERRRCINAIDECYSGKDASNVDPAWKVIFNYIMIQCFLGRYMPLERSSKEIDFLLTKEFELPFLASLWAAFSQLSLFIEPSFANVQALVALTVIAQRYFSVSAAKTSLHLACYAAKAIGLHRNDFHVHLAPEEIEEHRKVFWALFTVDKELSFVLGLTPCLPSYDCDTTLPEGLSQFSRFRARFSQVTESIYMALYSASTATKDEDRRERDIATLETELQELQECDALKYPAENSALQLESQYLYHLGLVMILRRSVDKTRFQRCIQEACQCISLLMRIRESDTTIGGYMVLRRPFQWRAPVPFFEAIASIFQERDLALQHEHLLSAKAFVDTLRSVAWTDDASSYCGNLLQVAETCLELTKSFVQACEAVASGAAGDVMSVECSGSEASSENAESD